MSRRGTIPVLIGRGEQMAALADALREVRQGGPAVVLAGGEAGIGKSRLIAEFTAAARRGGMHTRVAARGLRCHLCRVGQRDHDPDPAADGRG